jgi:hypothetical protein
MNVEKDAEIVLSDTKSWKRCGRLAKNVKNNSCDGARHQWSGGVF